MQTLIALGLVWIFAYNRARMYTILFCLVLALGLMSYLWGFAFFPWLVLAIVAFFYFVRNLRIRWLTTPIYDFFQKVLPPMNRTEMEALEAGDIWWEAELFQGDPDWKEFFGYARAELSEEEQRFLDNETQTLCDLLNDWDIVQEDRDLSPEA